MCQLPPTGCARRGSGMALPISCEGVHIGVCSICSKLTSKRLLSDSPENLSGQIRPELANIWPRYFGWQLIQGDVSRRWGVISEGLFKGRRGGQHCSSEVFEECITRYV